MRKYLFVGITILAIIIVVYTVITKFSVTWTLLEILTSEERIETFTEVVEVQNCGVPIEKTVNCSAGTTNNLEVSVGEDVNITQFSLGGNVSTGLGIDKESGESIKLDTPIDEKIFTYTIEKKYKWKTGEILARSPRGQKQNVKYIYLASCSINVIPPRVEKSCE